MTPLSLPLSSPTPAPGWWLGRLLGPLAAPWRRPSSTPSLDPASLSDHWRRDLGLHETILEPRRDGLLDWARLERR